MSQAFRRGSVAVVAAVALAATGAATAGTASAAPPKDRGTPAAEHGRAADQHGKHAKEHSKEHGKKQGERGEERGKERGKDGKRDKRDDRPAFTLTIAHNNDGESGLVPFEVTLPPAEEGGPRIPVEGEWGGVARFASVVERIERESKQGRPPAGQAGKRGFVLLNSGDNYLAGTAFAASREQDAPFYDAVAVDYLDYDALAIGNHEFDFGPEVLAEFIGAVDSAPFVSANLDVSAEPSLAQYTESGKLVASTVVKEKGERIGVIGLTTPTLPLVSSPRDVEVDSDLTGITQAQVDALTADGVEIIVVQSHLQNIREEVALAEQLTDVDAIIGGGGGELLAAADDVLIPGDEADDVYPLEATDADGQLVPVVTTEGNYGYVGRLVLNFDRAGELIAYDEDLSGVERVGSVGAGAVAPDAFLLENVQEPVEEFEAALAENVVADLGAIVLDCETDSVRTGETNCGNLIADAHLSSARLLADEFEVTTPQVGIQNGGGIRGNSVRADELTELSTFDLAPFGNFVSVAPEVTHTDFKVLLEEGVSSLPENDGGFVSPAGFSYTVDLSGTARVVGTDGVETTPGSRIQDVAVTGGPVIVADGVVLDPEATISVAGLNFSLGGGDGYPAQEFVTLPVTDQQSLARYLTDDLGGVVGAAYDGPKGRVTFE